MRRFVCAAFLVAAFAASGMSYAQPPANSYAKPGRILNVDGHSLNLVCLGSGLPVVVLDAGLGDWSPSWAPVQRRLASTTTTCSYDRAGYGFSGSARSPRTSMAIAKELHALLHAARLPAPYVLVGHSFGGLNQQAFAELYLPEVAGLVLVDGTPDDLAFPQFVQRLDDREMSVDRECASAAQAGEFVRNTPAFETCLDALWGLSSLPHSEVTPSLEAAVARQAHRAAPYQAVVSELRNLATSQMEVREHARPFGALPMVVLIATTHGESHMTGALRAGMLRFEPDWRTSQDRTAALSTCSERMLVQSDHYIQFYRPDVVVRAITNVIAAVRSLHRGVAQTCGRASAP